MVPAADTAMLVALSRSSTAMTVVACHTADSTAANKPAQWLLAQATQQHHVLQQYSFNNLITQPHNRQT
jgi:hypothetical protein